MEEENYSQQLPTIDSGKATDESLIRTHARIRRTPIAGSPVAFFTSFALIIVFVFCWFYVRRYSADWDTSVYVADRDQRANYLAWLDRPTEGGGAVAVDGAQVYAQNCVACHQANGEGLAGAFPPLAGAKWVTGDPEVPIKILLAGLGGEIEVKGQTYNGAMPAFGGAFDDATIAAVVNHIRTSWGNESEETVTAEQVATVRSDIGSQGTYQPSDFDSYFQ